MQNQQLLAYFTSPLQKTPLQTWNPFFLHLAKKDSSEGQHLLLLLGCLFFSYAEEDTPEQTGIPFSDDS